jgi:hypothetical protein
MRKPNVIRNKAIVLLKKADSQFFSFAVLAQLLGVKRDFAHRVYHRDKGIYHLPTVKQ